MNCGFAALGLLRLSAIVERSVALLGGLSQFSLDENGTVPLKKAHGAAVVGRHIAGRGILLCIVAPGRKGSAWATGSATSCRARWRVGPDGFTQVVNYYAQGRCASFSPATDAESVAKLAERCHPDAVLLPQDQANFGRDGPLVRRLEAAGFQPVAAGVRRRVVAGCWC